MGENRGFQSHQALAQPLSGILGRNDNCGRSRMMKSMLALVIQAGAFRIALRKRRPRKVYCERQSVQYLDFAAKENNATEKRRKTYWSS